MIENKRNQTTETSLLHNRGRSKVERDKQASVLVRMLLLLVRALARGCYSSSSSSLAPLRQKAAVKEFPLIKGGNGEAVRGLSCKTGKPRINESLCRTLSSSWRTPSDGQNNHRAYATGGVSLFAKGGFEKIRNLLKER